MERRMAIHVGSSDGVNVHKNACIDQAPDDRRIWGPVQSRSASLNDAKAFHLDLRQRREGVVVQGLEQHLQQSSGHVEAPGTVYVFGVVATGPAFREVAVVAMEERTFTLGNR